MAINEQLRAAVDGRRGRAAADSLCEACVMLFGIDAAAISLIFAGVASATLGSSDSAARVYDELQFTIGEGPCLDSVATRAPVLVADLAEPDNLHWPLYRPAMLDHKIRGIFAIPVVLAGEYVGALAVPMRAAGIVLGSLGLFGSRTGELTQSDLLVGQTLAHVACLAILQERPHAPSTVMARLRSALSHRIVVEQAKGFLRERFDVSVDEAFLLLRRYARVHGDHLTDVAQRLMTDPSARPALLERMGELAQS